MDQHNAPGLRSDALETLRNLAERLERHEGPWGTVMGGEKTGDRTFTMLYVDMDELAYEAMSFLYDHHLIINFN